ncbi:hypothetical protein KFL_000280480 [Klebsormidium nitens]|uniref:DUF7880 domain-containing protein n=1 Tax=Klebsormidium nitens TaxID=105231 RepID=A0A1Y1HMV9_KLENI|nr:hypothetical protein KFL_000280480 [Klebsormidium nitens]|eukprot:GAQ79343.1 hypothetical protein KFL_000280480 [Klebsormidium nitens]
MVVAASAYTMCPAIANAVTRNATTGVAAVRKAAIGAPVQSWLGSPLLGVLPAMGQRSHCCECWLRVPPIRVCGLQRKIHVRSVCTEEGECMDSQNRGKSSAARTRREAMLIAAFPFLALPVLPAHGLEVQKGKGDQNGLLNGALSRYIKRKKLEPLDSYLSQILLSDAQLQKLGDSIAGDAPDYPALRQRLRSGAFASFRTDLRAITQYSSEDGWGANVGIVADSSLMSLENLDARLLDASRTSAEKVDKVALERSVADFRSDLSKLVESVPAKDLAQAQKIASSYLGTSFDGPAGDAVQAVQATEVRPRKEEGLETESKQSGLKRGKGGSVALEDLL